MTLNVQSICIFIFIQISNRLFRLLSFKLILNSRYLEGDTCQSGLFELFKVPDHHTITKGNLEPILFNKQISLHQHHLYQSLVYLNSNKHFQISLSAFYDIKPIFQIQQMLFDNSGTERDSLKLFVFRYSIFQLF